MGMNVAAQRRSDDATSAACIEDCTVDWATPSAAQPAKRARLAHMQTPPSSIESDISSESSMSRSLEARTEIAQQRLQHKMTIELKEQELKERELRLKEMQLEFEMKKWEEAKQK